MSPLSRRQVSRGRPSRRPLIFCGVGCAQQALAADRYLISNPSKFVGSGGTPLTPTTSFPAVGGGTRIVLPMYSPYLPVTVKPLMLIAPEALNMVGRALPRRDTRLPSASNPRTPTLMLLPAWV